MSEPLNLLIGLAMGLNLLALGSSRLPSLIRAMSLQGVVLGVMPLLMEHDSLNWRVAAVVFATVVGKGLVIPGLLRRAMRAANIEREIEPFIGFVPSLLLGAAGTIAAVALARNLPLLSEHVGTLPVSEPAGTLVLPGAIASIFTGFILLIGRVKAISQVCGYLILENGIYLFGLLLIHSMPLMVESGILLDVTVGVFVIGIIVDRIQRAFDSLDTRKLTTLRE
jgi:hydrogenase-4 component E